MSYLVVFIAGMAVGVMWMDVLRTKSRKDV
jgi:hypothetical protein